MPGKKSSIFIRKAKAPKRPKYKQKPKLDKSTKPRKSGDALKLGVNAASSLSLHIQQLLDTTFAPAPEVLRGYLKRADDEVKDLLKLLIDKIGGTPGHDELTVTASTLMEKLIDTDPRASRAIAKIIKRDGS